MVGEVGGWGSKNSEAVTNAGRKPAVGAHETAGVLPVELRVRVDDSGTYRTKLIPVNVNRIRVQERSQTFLARFARETTKPLGERSRQDSDRSGPIGRAIRACLAKLNRSR
jgi:hypothetical protein